MKQNNPLVYAIIGVIQVARTENNFKIQAIIAILVVITGFTLHISTTEWLVIILCIGMVLIAEILNTALEKITDMVSPGWNEKAGSVKDVSAAAVLVASLISSVCGGIIFLPKI
jgi:diacylglycerol kinase